MSKETKKPAPPELIKRLARLLRVDPDLLVESWGKFKQNKGLLSQAETWREIATEVPRRVKASLALIVVLIGVILWIQTNLLTPQITNMVILPVAPGLPTGQSASGELPLPLEEVPIALESVKLAQSAGQKTPQPPPLFNFHTVQEDETLISIAAAYDLTTEALLVANDIRDPNAVVKGTHLLIPPKDGLSEQKIMVHEVKAGDTLLSIASKYGSSVKDIQKANPYLASDEMLEPGQTVAVPIVFLTDNPALKPGALEDIIYHTVRAGDIPLTIAAQYEIPVAVLLSANEIVDPTRLRVGQQLLIPPNDGISLGYPVILYELLESDTLVGIASRFGSSVKDILAVNPDLDPANLEVGQLVAVPVIFSPPRPTPAPSAPRPTPGPPPSSIPGLQEQLVQAVNARRQANGLPPHTFDAQLSDVALSHAQDMYVRDFFAHVNPDGESLRDRLNEFDVSFVRAGENIQRNTQPRERTVEAAVNWFMNSAPHRANILHQTHNRIGVAIVEGPPGWYTFVLNFAQR